MSILKEYEERMQIAPLTSEEIAHVIEDAEAFLTGARRSRDRVHIDEDARVILWLSDLVQVQADRLAVTKIPEGSRCSYCLVAAGGTDEAWMDLPTFTVAEGQAHAQSCEHNPLVQKIRRLEALLEEHGFRRSSRVAELEAQVEDLRGRALGIDDNLRDAIRALLNSEAPAGELRRALAELVR